jgi:predicted XRE-type DNA-binding protein
MARKLKPLRFRGSSLDERHAFPVSARREAGYQLEQHIKAQGWTQAEAARLLGVTQPRVSDLMRGKIDLFGLDTLVNMLTAAGLRVELRIAWAA